MPELTAKLFFFALEMLWPLGLSYLMAESCQDDKSVSSLLTLFSSLSS